MKKFKFRLHTPLKIKYIKEKMAKQKFAQALLVRQCEAQKLAFLKEQDTALQDGLREVTKDFVSVSQLLDHHVYSNALRRIIKDQEEEVKLAENNCMSSRRDYIEARKEKQVLEKVKEKKYEKHIKSLDKEEQKQSDEAAVNLFNRKDGGLSEYI
jgi:flagellar FliJ protein